MNGLRYLSCALLAALLLPAPARADSPATPRQVVEVALDGRGNASVRIASGADNQTQLTQAGVNGRVATLQDGEDNRCEVRQQGLDQRAAILQRGVGNHTRITQ